jgi:NTE family protein
MPGLDIHAGISLALEDAGIFPTHLSGTSAGAIVTAAQAVGISAHEFAFEILAPLADSAIRAPRFAWQLRLPWIQSVHGNRKLAALLEKHVGQRRAILPAQIWATRVQDMQRTDVALSHPLAEACLASAAIPGLFPPVQLNGQDFADGGLRVNLPLPNNWRDFDHVFLLIASPRPTDYHGASALTAAIRAFQTLMADQILDAVDQVQGANNVTIIWPNCRTDAGMLHFDHSLIKRTQAEVAETLRGLKFS